MAGVAFITGTKYVNGSTTGVFYIGSVQDDGYLYFNDDTLYRCRKDASYPQLFYFPKQQWVSTTVLKDLNIIDFDPASVLDKIFHQGAGGGATSPNSSIETAVQWAVDAANNRYITYSQANRHLKDPDNFYTGDCSSFVITAMYVGGFDAPATYTGDMRSGFESLGFKWYPGSYWDASELQRGDIQLNEALHTNMYIGNNQDVDCGSTPCRVIQHTPNFWGTGWDGILRYEG